MGHTQSVNCIFGLFLRSFARFHISTQFGHVLRCTLTISATTLFVVLTRSSINYASPQLLVLKQFKAAAVSVSGLQATF